ncbi:MAG: transcriptional regulator [Deltaproteobacteria bacterium]|nr:transcriptional regulator [Deltaproteobacteria bacterium]
MSDAPLLISDLHIPLERDLFLRTLIRELAGVLEEVVGYSEAAGYISLVGKNIGDWANALYKKELGVSRLTLEQLAAVLVDFKARIQGKFMITELNKSRIVLTNTACPFGDKVLSRSSMCMMTSNVFGLITSENLGYAKVVIEKSIARGDGCCRVIIHLTSTAESEAVEGREYFRVD